jgi:transcriptional regulator with XRE-family HTH domain
VPPDFGPRLKALREKAGLSGAQLAEKAGTSRQQVHQLERGDYRPSWDMVQALAAALGVPTDTFRSTS